ncbi:MAG: CoA transferase [Chloroflexi bacterium]|nr:CoA transferase [Chloroflexota bacterium]
MAGPLAGVRVIEMSTWAALPGAGVILADMGADVVKVEDPETGGDPTRGFQLVKPAKGAGEFAPVWEQDNRNKKSVTVNVNRPEGQEILRKLLKDADIFLTSTRPATLERFKLSYQHLRDLNPRLIFAHLSGFGPKGPDSDRAGYDSICFWSRVGIALSLAEPGGNPVSPRAAMGDHTTSLTLVGAITAALYARSQTGKGQMVQTSLFHAGLWFSSVDLVSSSVTQTDAKKLARKVVGNPLVNSYKTKDGWITLVNLQSERFWDPICRAIGQPELAKDPRFATHQTRMQNGPPLIDIFDAAFTKHTTAEWIAKLDREGIRWGRMQTVLDCTKDEQAWANGYFHKLDHPEAGEVGLVTSPMQFSDTPTSVRSAAPLLGQHTEEVLLEKGYSWEDLEKLKTKGVIL